MNDPVSENREMTTEPKTGSALAWFLATLLAGIVLSFLLGSATPRIRLNGLFPLIVGGLCAFGSLALLDKFNLKISRLKTLWILILAVDVFVGSSLEAYYLWRTDLEEAHAASTTRIEQMLRGAPPEKREKILRDNAAALQNKLTFRIYLSQRLDSVACKFGRREAWDPPVPEIVYACELVLAFVGALLVLVRRQPDTSQVDPTRSQFAEPAA